jgi:hypothetical protein
MTQVAKLSRSSVAADAQLGVKRQWLKAYLAADDQRSEALYRDSQQVRLWSTGLPLFLSL